MTKNTEYVIVNEKGIFMGGKPITHYQKQEILDIDGVKKAFAEIKKNNPYVKELHVGLFGTEGVYTRQGNPSGSGLNIWCRAKFNNGKNGNWVAMCGCPIASICYSVFISNCCDAVRSDASFQSAVLGQYEAEIVNVGDVMVMFQPKVR